MYNKNRASYTTGQFAFTHKEFGKLLQVCGTIEDELLLKMGVAFGLRREDMVNVRIKNINPDEMAMTYYEKKKDRIRTVPIGLNMMQLIRKYTATLPKNQTLLFAFSGSTAYRKLQRLCIVAGIPRRPFHALRATCVKFCQQAKWSPEQVSELTGDTIRVIQEHYATPSQAEMSEVMLEKETI